MNLWKSVTPRLLPLHEMPPRRTKAGVWKNNHQCHVKIKELLFPNKLRCLGMFSLPETKRKKKSSLCYQIKYQHKNIQEQAATTEDILCWSSLMINRAAEEQKRDTQARVCCCSAHVLPLKEEFSSGREMLLKAIRKSPHNTAVLSIHMEHLLKKKEVPPHKTAKEQNH